MLLLVAPAGYGKTTLARQWLQAKDRAAWHSFTRASEDFRFAADELVRTLSEATSCSLSAVRERLAITSRPENDAALLADLVVEEIVDWPRELWLALDDYQFIAGHVGAETFVERLLDRLAIPTVLTSRTQPEWASARRALYGDIVVVGSDSLAMTQAEAESVFRAVGTRPDAALISVAKGWPAVVALGALAPTRGLDLLNGALDTFLAEEVCRPIDDGVLDTLGLLSGLERFSSEEAVSLLGGRAARSCIRVALDYNLAADRLDGLIEIHPLIRDALKARLQERQSPAMKRLARRVGMRMLDGRRWDEAFDVIERFNDLILHDRLLTRGIRHALENGRSASVQRWIAYARMYGITSSQLSLAEAEIALREGAYVRAESLATGAERQAETENVSTDFRALALLTAGRAAHLAGRDVEASKYFRAAQDHARDARLKKRALWGELTSEIDLESECVGPLLGQLSKLAEDPEDRVFLASRFLVFEARSGSLAGIYAARSALQLLPDTPDALLRTSFLNVFGYCAALAGEYDDASEALSVLAAEAARLRLDFVAPYARLGEAVVASSCRRFDDAAALLDDATGAARRLGDDAALATSAALRARLLIALGDFERAAAEAVTSSRCLAQSFVAELAMSRALALASTGQLAEASKLARHASGLSSSVEVQGLGAAVRATVACRAERNSEPMVLELISYALSACYAEGLITAYRGCNEIARVGARQTSVKRALQELMFRANDHELIRICGFGAHAGVEALSKREAEVYQLVRAGLANREIASRLYIAEPTVKTHVHRILGKLHVKSRTELIARHG